MLVALVSHHGCYYSLCSSNAVGHMGIRCCQLVPNLLHRLQQGQCMFKGIVPTYSLELIQNAVQGILRKSRRRLAVKLVDIPSLLHCRPLPHQNLHPPLLQLRHLRPKEFSPNCQDIAGRCRRVQHRHVPGLRLRLQPSVRRLVLRCVLGRLHGEKGHAMLQPRNHMVLRRELQPRYRLRGLDSSHSLRAQLAKHAREAQTRTRRHLFDRYRGSSRLDGPTLGLDGMDLGLGGTGEQ